MTILQDILAAVGWQTRVTENFRSVSPAGLYGINPATTTGLTLGYLGGEFNGVTVGNGTVALTASNTNYVVANRTTGVVTAATNTTNWLNTGTYLQLYQFVAGASTFTIASTSDKRQAIGGAGSAGGMTNPMTTTGDIIYSSSGSTPARLGVGSNGYVLTLAAGVPTWAAAASGFSNPMTTSGDLILGGTSGAPGRLGIGGNGQVLTVTAGAVGWAASAAGFVNPMTTVGDLIVGGASGAAGRLAAGTATFVLTSNGAGVAPTWQAAGGGGSLTNWTESVNTSTPNATVPLVRFLATNAATNVDAVISPKGTGSFSLNPSDNTTANGNKRGSYAVDLLLSRANATQVASGNYSFIGAGQNNICSGANSAIVGGTTNSASGIHNFIGGRRNTTSQSDAHALGDSNTSSEANAISIGTENTASAFYSMSLGYRGTSRSLYGSLSYSSGYFSAVGDAQKHVCILRAATTSATTTTLNAQAGSDGATNVFVLPTGSAFKVTAEVVARQATTGDMATWTIKFAIKNVSGTCSLVGSPVVTQDFADTGASTWTIAVTANNTLKSPTFTVTGEAAKSIKWTADVTAVELVG